MLAALCRPPVVGSCCVCCQCLLLSAGRFLLDHVVSAVSACCSLQATFDISLTTTTGLIALSNMPVIATQDLSNGDTTTHFATSPPMSTYLVALIMGNLTSVSTMVPHPEPGQPDRNVSIYGTPDR